MYALIALGNPKTASVGIYTFSYILYTLFSPERYCRENNSQKAIILLHILTCQFKIWQV